MNVGQVSNSLRQLKLLYLVDKLQYFYQKSKNSKINKEFEANNPTIILPPDYLIYESFQMNYDKYYNGGKETAIWLKKYLKKHTQLEGKKILDWGCGPGRIIRHLPNLVGNNCEFFATDYNEKTINWCSQNIPEVKFNKNSLSAKLPYPDDYFDVIYGISIFTHLSEKLHYDWYRELWRILKPNGILFLTTQGDNYKPKLTNKELGSYETGKLVVRGMVKEGHRTYSAFHPKVFMNMLFKNDTVLEHVETISDVDNWQPNQDVWIVKKIS
ncbi:class I SAM-dependent methyltransferase [Urechidicola croceus]|uniref:Methyltransferase type 11 n=1 Tax=Urechidicola croceus TaxID=1850246 RepID=A0A1D8P6W5_9FLAO|nr:class I SAM-dependent methyltransferase [Urechidicola croceus]AOW20309.1 methyltransferase type 11 [Urechidicola croceus]